MFSEWDKIFKDPMTTAAAIDRLVHHSTILELTGKSYRNEEAEQRRSSVSSRGRTRDGESANEAEER